jgi:dinuclear metal center YbgI/SA1388 family protein
MLSVKEVVRVIEESVPLSYQESYDNSGLQIGDPRQEISSILLTIDITEEVIDEAIASGANLIVSHHPLIFGGLKRITGSNYVERCIVKAIQNNIALYACHTNIDNIISGVSFRMAAKMGLANIKVLAPLEGALLKLVVFVPANHAGDIRKAIFAAGAGHIGEYDCCSFNTEGAGTFRASEQAHPFVGEIGKLHTEAEVRIETILPKPIQHKVISAMLKAHPYEEVAYDIYPLANKFSNAGSGAIGNFENPMDETAFLTHLQKTFQVGAIRHTNLSGRKVSKVALCGGSGSFLFKDARNAGADAFVSGDFKYHQFFDADNRIMIADIGHFESEQYTTEIFYEILIKKFPSFAIRFTKVKTNPIKYF